MKKDKIILLFLSLLVILADTYFLFPWILSSSFLCVLLALYFVFNKKLYISPIGKKVLGYSYIFLLILFVIDILHGNDFLQSIATVVIASSLPLLLVYFKSQKNSIYYINYFFRLLLIYNFVFCLLQLTGIYVTAGMVLSKLGVFGISAEEFVGLSETQGLRTTGAYNSTIGFACINGIATIFFYYMWRVKVGSRMGVFLILSIILLLTTQTRSALFSVIPAIIFAEFLITKKFKIKRILLMIPLTLAVWIGSEFGMPLLQEKYPRLFLSIEEDGSIVHRIQANVYAIVGTYDKSPIIGLPKEDAIEAMNIGFSKLGLFFGEKYIDEVTHHNQVAFYFRYYGFIGLVSFILLYLVFFRYSIQDNRIIVVKRILFSVIFFHFLYTFSHNNKLIQDYYIWIVLGINFSYLTKNRFNSDENRVCVKQI